MNLLHRARSLPLSRSFGILFVLASTSSVAFAQADPLLPTVERRYEQEQQPKTAPGSIPVTIRPPSDTEATTNQVAREPNSAQTSTSFALEEPLDPEKYICGRGDVFDLNFWGQQNFRFRVTVDAEGRTFIPKIGYVDVSGKSLKDARETMKKLVRRYYPGLSFDLSLAAPRTLLVHVVGFVPHPGLYVANPIMRVSTVLANAGASTAPQSKSDAVVGSRRRIEITRRDGTRLNADLALYELTGDTKLNPFVMDGDVIRVPFPEVVVMISGAVKRPGSYELIASKDLNELLTIAGGFRPTRTTSLPGRVIHRDKKEHSEETSIPFGPDGSLRSYPLKDGDEVIVPSVSDLQRTVLLIGPVAGAAAADEVTSVRRLSYYEGATVGHLIDGAGGLGASADLKGAYIKRKDGSVDKVDLEKLLVMRDFSADRSVAIGDSIIVPQKRRSVLVEGAVMHPGPIAYNPAFGGQEYIATAGGAAKNARGESNYRLVSSTGQSRKLTGRTAVEPGDSIRRAGAVLLAERGRTAGPWRCWTDDQLGQSGDFGYKILSSMVERRSTFAELKAGRRNLVVGALAGLLLCGGYAFLAPKWYEAEISVVPGTPAKSPGGLAAAALSLDLPLDLGSSDVERIQTVMKSRTVTDAMIEKFDLKERYRKTYIEDARTELWKHCLTKVDKKANVVSITCEDKDPKIAQAMTAYFGVIGNKILRRVSASSAAEERRFLEQRVEEARRELGVTSQRVREFEEKHNIVDLPEQSRAVVSAISSLRGELLSKQLELDYLHGFSSSDEATASQLRRQVGVMESKMRTLEDVPAEPKPADGHEPAVATKKNSASKAPGGIFPVAMTVPKLRAELTQLYRDQKIQETLFLMLMERFETARVNEARDTSAFQVLDEPVVPTHHSSPKRGAIVVAGFFLGLFAGAVFTLRDRLLLRRV